MVKKFDNVELRFKSISKSDKKCKKCGNFLWSLEFDNPTGYWMTDMYCPTCRMNKLPDMFDFWTQPEKPSIRGKG